MEFCFSKNGLILPFDQIIGEKMSHHLDRFLDYTVSFWFHSFAIGRAQNINPINHYLI